MGSLNGVFSGFLSLLGLTLLLLSGSVSAQTGNEPVALPKSVSLPRSFAQFSPGDVLTCTSSFSISMRFRTPFSRGRFCIPSSYRI